MLRRHIFLRQSTSPTGVVCGVASSISALLGGVITKGSGAGTERVLLMIEGNAEVDVEYWLNEEIDTNGTALKCQRSKGWVSARDIVNEHTATQSESLSLTVGKIMRILAIDSN